MTICILCAESVMYVQFLESNKQKQKKKKNIQKSYSNLFETTLVKSENCTVKITFEPLKIISTNVYLISASFIRYPTPLIISAYILP